MTANGIAGPAAGALDGSSLAAFPIPLPVFMPTGEPAELLDTNGLVLCKNCGMCRNWATRPHLPTPCVSAHHLVDGAALLHWAMERLERIFIDLINEMASADRAEYPVLSTRFQAHVEDLLDEMSLRFGPRAHLWHSRAVTVVTEQVETWMALDREEGRTHV